VTEKEKFRVLFRHFFLRFVDNDVLASEGDIRQAVAQVAALLGGMGFVAALFIGLKHSFRLEHLTFAERQQRVWSDQEVLLAMTVAAVGLMTVFLWDNLFPDLRDCLALSSLPLRLRTVFAAKTASLLAVLGSTVLALNAFASLAIPVAVAGPTTGVAGLLLAFTVFWITTLAAGAFVFFLLLGAQGVVIQLLGHGAFRRLSSHLQLAAFFLVLASFFLAPRAATPAALANPSWQVLATPSMWFLGLQQVLLGDDMPIFRDLAALAAAGFAAALAIVALTYALGYARHMRKTIEQADLTAGRIPRRPAWLTGWAAPLLRRPLERALFHFVRNTMARSRRHRLVLALYGGVGVAYVFDSVETAARLGRPLDRPSAELLGPPLILLFFLLVGLRAAFSLPMELRANWIFRMTERADPGECVAAAQKAMLALGVVPIAAASLAIYTPLWGWQDSARQAIFVLGFGLVLIELLIARFNKIPFTCSYLPGKANLKVMFGVYWALFMMGSYWVVFWELRAMRDLATFAIVVAALAACAWLLSRRRRRLRFIYEERVEPPLLALDIAARR
jgi:hypothetical protein